MSISMKQGSFGTLSVGGEEVAEVTSWRMDFDSRCDILRGDDGRKLALPVEQSLEFTFHTGRCDMTGWLPGSVYCMSFAYDTREWEFPRDRFITYEANDESWCRALGIGREVLVHRKYEVPQVLTDAKVGPSGEETLLSFTALPGGQISSKEVGRRPIDETGNCCQ